MKAFLAVTKSPAPVIAGCLSFAVVLFLPAILNDGDTWWQISTGGWILDHGAIPATDPFSFTAGDRPWAPHEWLAETLMALAFRAGGLRAVMVLAAAAAGLTAAVLLASLRRFLPGLYAVTALVIALSSAAPSLLARPHLLAWPCLALWCAGLVAARANRTPPRFALLPIMLLWVNLHGSFILGLLLAGAFMVEALLDAGANRLQVLTGWAKFILAALAAALINPDFAAGVVFPFHLVGMTSLAWIGEWKPADLSHFGPLEIVILGALALGLTGKLRLPPIRLLMFLGLVHGALAHARNEPILGIVGALILAEPLGAALGRGAAKTLGTAWPAMAAGAALTAVAALSARAVLTLSPERSGLAFATTLDAVPPALRAQPVLNEYGLGGALIFNGVRPFIDSRADLYGDAFLTRYRSIAAPDLPALQRALSDYAIAWTIFPAGEPIVAVMDEMPGWRRLADRDGIVIHARAAAQHKAVQCE